jgi:S-adenosylmethionine hydrolase
LPKTAGFLEIKPIHDIPQRNIDFAAFALNDLALRPNQEIFIHVTDPRVGNGEDRSILVTQNNGIFIDQLLSFIHLI